ncbi:MAG: peroxidase family protein [Pseudomonadales bacterium]
MVAVCNFTLPNAVLAVEQNNEPLERRHSPTQPLQSHEDVAIRSQSRTSLRAAAATGLEVRSVDGSGNNPSNRNWGRADTELVRLTYSDYTNRLDSPSGIRRPSPRAISSAVIAQPTLIENDAGATDFVWQWGQFLDHDIDLIPTIKPVERFDIPVPFGDPFFDPQSTGVETISFDRSLYSPGYGVRQQLNIITSYIDGSNVYGSEYGLSRELRRLDGSGKLKTSEGDLLPFDTEGELAFIAGDERSNEQVGLTALHTLFLREHNHWADRLHEENPGLDGEEIYQMARMMVGAEIQAITYREFLPILLGPDALSEYNGYQQSVNPAISNEFATAAYRFGHSMVSPQLLRLDANNEAIAAGNLQLREAFFNAEEFINSGIEPLLRGLAKQVAQQVDNFVNEELCNFLFGEPGQGGFDLASLNIQRGRDHGLPSYNDVRRNLGLLAAEDFTDVSPDPEVQSRLASVYETVEDLDLWVGGLAEAHVPGALVGETFHIILKDQFERLRDGDRFWHEIYLPQALLEELEQITLSTIIRRNTDISDEIQDNVFLVPAAVEAVPDSSLQQASRSGGGSATLLFFPGLVLVLLVSRIRRKR